LSKSTPMKTSHSSKLATCFNSRTPYSFRKKCIVSWMSLNGLSMTFQQLVLENGLSVLENRATSRMWSERVGNGRGSKVSYTWGIVIVQSTFGHDKWLMA